MNRVKKRRMDQERSEARFAPGLAKHSAHAVRRKSWNELMPEEFKPRPNSFTLPRTSLQSRLSYLTYGWKDWNVVASPVRLYHGRADQELLLHSEYLDAETRTPKAEIKPRPRRAPAGSGVEGNPFPIRTDDWVL